MAEARLSHLRMPEVKERQFEVAVLPIGSTEPHARHLAYGTDFFAVERFAEQLVEEANRRGARCILLPTMPFSTNVNLDDCPWAMSLRPRTLLEFVRDVVDSVVRQGVRKVLVINGHGGNTGTLMSGLRELHGRCGAFVALAEQWAASSDVEAEVKETDESGHACEIETSVMLHLCPEHVTMEAAEPTRTRKTIFSQRRGLSFVSPWHAYTVNTGIGDPTKATAEKGRRMIEAAVDRLATTLKELSDAPLDDLFPYRD
jgi:creatinine amidohydrolase